MVGRTRGGGAGWEFEREELEEEMLVGRVGGGLVVWEVIRSEVEWRWVVGRWGVGRLPRIVAPGSWGEVGVWRGGLLDVASVANGRKVGESSSSSSKFDVGG